VDSVLVVNSISFSELIIVWLPGKFTTRNKKIKKKSQLKHEILANHKSRDVLVDSSYYSAQIRCLL